MHLRIIKDIGTYRRDQRLEMSVFNARQLIVTGIAVADDSPVVEAMLTAEPSGVIVDEMWQGERPKRRHRRREVADDE